MITIDRQFLTLKSALKLEIAGMKRHGRSAYSIIKEQYALHGNRESVLAQMETIWSDWKASHDTDHH